jgi:hypothetical protein
MDRLPSAAIQLLDAFDAVHDLGGRGEQFAVARVGFDCRCPAR